MKTKKLYIGLIVFFFLLPGCITDQEVTTTFAPDGSCLRVVSFNTDEEDYDLSDLNIPVDSTWTITIEKDTADTTKFHVVAQKKFSNVEEVNFLYDSLKHNFSGIKRKITWKTQFRWFYTYYRYTEKISALFHQRPMSDFLSPEEIQYAMASDEEKDSLFGDMDTTALKKLDDQVDEKGWQWIEACTFDEFYAGLIKTAEEHPSGRFNPDSIQADKEKLYDTFDTMEDSAFNAYFTMRYGVGTPDSLTELYSDNFKTFNQLEDVVGRTFGEEYENQVKLPGTLAFSNAEKNEKGLLSWNVSAMKFLGEDFVMQAVSRKTNTWAFYVAAIVMIIALFFWLMTGMKKNRTKS